METEDNHFGQEFDKKLEVTLETILNPKVMRVMKTLQASYNEDTYKIIKQS